MAEEEAAVLDTFLELLVVVALVDMSVAIAACFLEDVVLNVVEHFLHALHDTVEADRLFLQGVTTHDLDGVVFQVAATHDEAYRNTLELVVGKLEARTLVVGVVVLHADAQLAQLVDDGLQLGCDLLQLLIALVDRNDDHLDRSQLWRQYETVVVAVDHDERTHQTGRDAP